MRMGPELLIIMAVTVAMAAGLGVVLGVVLGAVIGAINNNIRGGVRGGVLGGGIGTVAGLLHGGGFVFDIGGGVILGGVLGAVLGAWAGSWSLSRVSMEAKGGSPPQFRYRGMSAGKKRRGKAEKDTRDSLEEIKTAPLPQSDAPLDE